MYFKYEYFYEVYGWIIENGVRKIGHIEVKGTGFVSKLEKILSSVKARPGPRLAYTRNELDGSQIERIVKDSNESRTVYVNNLGPNILGMYDASKDLVYILEGMDAATEHWVKAHEYAHRRRAYMGESQDERLVDEEASAVVGYNRFPDRHAANYR